MSMVSGFSSLMVASSLKDAPQIGLWNLANKAVFRLGCHLARAPGEFRHHVAEIIGSPTARSPVIESAAYPRAHFASPACGGGRIASKMRYGWRKLSPFENCQSLQRPHP